MEYAREEVVMVSEVGEMMDVLDVLLGVGKTRFTRDQILDALALLLLDTVETNGELPDDPSLIQCLEGWRVRVFHDTQAEQDLDFPDRARRYFELHPLDPELFALLGRHLEQRQSQQYERESARSKRLLGLPMARVTVAPKPANGRSWLEVRASTSTPKT